MDLRVYVDGVARIICDLTRTTTVHDIIIALAQYKGKAGRYSLIERTPNGTQRILSPNELTCELIHHPDWAYILQQKPSNRDSSFDQKRSKSLDERKTPVQQTIVEMPSAVTSSSSSSTSGHLRTVKNNNIDFSTSSVKSSEKKKRSNLHHVFPSINTNNSNSNIYINELPRFHEQKRPSRTPIPNTSDNHRANLVNIHRSKSKSALPSTISENSAFQIVHNPNNNFHTNTPHQQEQYNALLHMLKAQKIQFEQQQKELDEKQKEIEYREMIIRQAQIYQDNIQHELQLLEEHDQRLFSECQVYAQEYSTDKLDIELEYQKKLHLNYEHLQQQLTRCSSTVEQKRQLQEQIQLNIEQTHQEIEQIQTHINNDKKEIAQYQHELDSSNSTIKQQEESIHKLSQRTDDIKRIIHQRRQVETEFTKLDDVFVNNLVNSSYHFHPTTTDILMPIHLQFMNHTLWNLSPSGMWV